MFWKNGLKPICLVTCTLCGVSLLSTYCLADEGSSSGREVDFATEILPILSDKCFVCHGPDAQDASDLRLDSFEAATSDRGGYRAINVDTPADSEILRRIHSQDEPMPPADAEKSLTSTERQLIDRWIRQGGRYAMHWSFVKPKKTLPAEREDVSRDQAIDAFVEARLQQQQVKLAPEAERAVLARRVALVLTGLPPEPEQLRTFLADDSEDAYSTLIDQLLASPRYGEHQARYWLDAVRYGDTHGLHLDNRRGIYPYRDWVVHAFNKNLPFDQFITWQLAGDLLPDPTLEQRVATGFVRMNPTTSEGGVIPAEFQAKNNFDRVETLGTTLLGMTMICARCHTHKYDPIPHTEYYELLAFFNSTSENALDGNSYVYAPVVKAPDNQHQWKAWQDLRMQREELQRQIDSVGEDAEQQSTLKSEFDRVSAELSKLEGSFETTTLVAEELASPRETKVLARGEYDMPTGPALNPDTLSIMGAFPEDAPRNRLGLARWLTSPEHPIVARVLVNRFWQQVFGEGLVRTPEDFGLQGQQPTHPRLLDWLAVEFQESGWDLKQLLRQMVHSKTFRQTAAWRPDVDDPDNRLLARGPSHRLDAEVLRDLGLWASGLLDDQMGGEGVKPYQPKGLWSALMHPASNTKHYERDTGTKLYRRSLYVYWKRTSPHPMMTLFDAPSRETSCVRRSRTNTSLQSLGLLNETQRLEIARVFAERLLSESDDDDQRLDLLFLLPTCRKPNETQRSACHELLRNARGRYADATEDANRLLDVGDAPRSTSLDPVEHAAWTQVVSTVLASDLAILLY
ncbi:MAG: PSD1 and planctomycete cytochrome C domain-containing protein [Pirellulaceae bacterium]